MSTYTSRATRCNCHPESCNCDPLEIVAPDGTRVATAFDKERAKVLLDHLNRPAEQTQAEGPNFPPQADKAVQIIAELRNAALTMLGAQFDDALAQTVAAYSTPETKAVQEKVRVCQEALEAAKIGLRDWEVPANRYKALDAVNEALNECKIFADTDCGSAKQLDADAVKDIAVRLSKSCKAMEYYEFDQSGLEAFASEIMNGAHTYVSGGSGDLWKSVNAYCNDLLDCAAALDCDPRLKIYATEIRTVVNGLRKTVPGSSSKIDFSATSTNKAVGSALGLPYTEEDLMELVGIAQDMRNIEHWKMKAGSKILADILAKLLVPLKAAQQQNT